MVATKTNWEAAFQPLIKKYKGKTHPLDYKSTYQLLVMVILSAQDSDRHINMLAPPLFDAFPNMESLSRADYDALIPFVGKVRNSGNKMKWLMQIAQTLKADKNIPMTMEELTKLPGVGRKSANVILRESGKKAEGIIVDLHVVRVAPRIGVATGTDPKKIEQQLMEALPQKDWGEVGMAISFLGRETCRPTDPKHGECVMKAHCEYFKSLHGKKGTVKEAKTAAAPKKAVKKAAVKKTVKKAVATKKAVGKKVVAKKAVKKPVIKKKAVKKGKK